MGGAQPPQCCLRDRLRLRIKGVKPAEKQALVGTIPLVVRYQATPECTPDRECREDHPWGYTPWPGQESQNRSGSLRGGVVTGRVDREPGCSAPARSGIADSGQPGPSVAHSEEPPGARNTLEFVLTFFLETQVRSGNQVDDCPGHEDLTWLGSALHTLSQMHGYAGYVFAAAFDFTRVEACPNLQA